MNPISTFGNRKRRQFGECLSAFKAMDYLVCQHLPLPMSVIRDLASALEVGDHLDRMEGMAWAIVAETLGDALADIAATAGVSEGTIRNWRNRRDYQDLLAYAHEHGSRALLLSWPLDLDAAWTSMRATAQSCHAEGNERGDKYPPRYHRERLIDLALWYSSRGQHLPGWVRWAVVCALGLGNWSGGFKRETMVALNGHPTSILYIRAAVAEGQAEMEGRSRSASDIAAELGVDKSTVIRWRKTAVYQWNRSMPAIYARAHKPKKAKPRVRAKVALEAARSLGRPPLGIRIIL